MSSSAILFNTGSYFFFIENDSITWVEEIIKNFSYYSIPNAPDYIEGAGIYRGKAVPIINLRKFLFPNTPSEDSSEEEKSYFLTVNHKNDIIVLKVDKSVYNISLNDDQKFNLISINDPSSTNKESVFIEQAIILHDENEHIALRISIGQLSSVIQKEIQAVKEIFSRKNLDIVEEREVPEELITKINIPLIKEKTSVKIASEEFIKKRQITTSVDKLSGILVKVNQYDIFIPTAEIIDILKRIKNTYILPNKTMKAIIGNINYRGEVVTLYDLSYLLFDKPMTHDNKNKIIFFNVEGTIFGLIVDSVSKFTNIPLTNIHDLYLPDSIADHKSIFKGAYIDSQDDKIVLILELPHLFYYISKELNFNKTKDQVPFFINDHETSQVSTTIEDQLAEYNKKLLFRINNYLFSFPYECVKQIQDRHLFITKEYDDPFFKGVAIHNDIYPLVDTKYLLFDDDEIGSKSEPKIGILIHSDNHEMDVEFLVDEVIGQYYDREFDDVQSTDFLANELLNNFYQAFVNFRGEIALILNPDELLQQTYLRIKNSLNIEPDKENFINTLNEDQRDIADTLLESYKEFEEFLSSYGKEGRKDYLVLLLNNQEIAIDSHMIKEVIDINDVKVITVESDYSPIHSIISYKEKKYPLLDFHKLLFSSPKPLKLGNLDFLIRITINNTSYFISTPKISGIFTIYKENLLSWSNTDIFINEEICDQKFNIAGVINDILIIKNEYLNNILVSKDLNILLEKLKLN